MLASTIFISSVHAQLLHVAVAGMAHDHVYNIMHQYQNGEVIIDGIAERNPDLVAKYKKLFNLPDSLFYTSLDAMLQHIKKPDAVLAYNAISEHIDVVEACAPKHISVMVEKPLATTVADANKIATLAKQYNIKVLTNYETTWYPSNQTAYQLVNENAIGDLRKMVVHDGHQGPKEIGCSKEFLAWLTDPVKNGGGAVMDFGCYGANLMTWFMKDQTPISVTATIKHIKPDVYPKVDDDATIVVEYKNTTGIIEASWNWPFGIKDMELFGNKGYLHALNGNTLQQRDTGAYTPVQLNEIKFKDNIQYLAAVLRGETDASSDLSSLENNLIVVKILEAAKQSAKEGKKIML